uniref:Uncharacterized protein n=1 Tax=Plectus sambesii TaxID=2011161 RepID=A0A914VLI5_9BILA
MQHAYYSLWLFLVVAVNCAGAYEWEPQYLVGDDYNDAIDDYSNPSGAWRAGLQRRSSDEEETLTSLVKRNMRHIWRSVLRNMPAQLQKDKKPDESFDHEVDDSKEKRGSDADKLIRFGKSVDAMTDDEEMSKRNRPGKILPFNPMGKRNRPGKILPFHPMGKRFHPYSKRPMPRRFDTAHFRLGKRGMRSSGKKFQQF